MVMLCCRNGSLNRTAVRDAHPSTRGSWEAFSEALQQTPPGNAGRLGLVLHEPEIVPELPLRKPLAIRLSAAGAEVASFDDHPAEVRAVVEARFLSLLLHCQRMGVHPRRLVATGGASGNRAIIQNLQYICSGAHETGQGGVILFPQILHLLSDGSTARCSPFTLVDNPPISRHHPPSHTLKSISHTVASVMADVFGLPVRLPDVTDSAPYGAALRARSAAHTPQAADRGDDSPVAGDAVDGGEMMRVQPGAGAHERYVELLGRWAEMERLATERARATC
ncbi:putative xylulose kinase [Paratrimastix pyriformis]|uniref:Xylulose kinase n=1 Tax=Paratrimastix pyriformis TaxID=342808 RepID=A0ABQ8U8G5_9EUKA|nr:putative xylulose kinase [Paratrimastix pyriformis]